MLPRSRGVARRRREGARQHGAPSAEPTHPARLPGGGADVEELGRADRAHRGAAPARPLLRGDVARRYGQHVVARRVDASRRGCGEYWEQASTARDARDRQARELEQRSGRGRQSRRSRRRRAPHAPPHPQRTASGTSLTECLGCPVLGEGVGGRVASLRRPDPGPRLAIPG